jgi:hypothetical protein
MKKELIKKHIEQLELNQLGLELKEGFLQRKLLSGKSNQENSLTERELGQTQANISLIKEFLKYCEEKYKDAK